jgi:hypothetical protein
MVASRLNPTIEYIDKTKIEDIDKNINTELYEFEVPNNHYTIMIAIGKYIINKNILLNLPIYLFYNNKFVSQIGVFEYKITKENEKEKDYGIINKNGNVVLEKLDQPLFYSFVTNDYLLKYQEKQVQVQAKSKQVQAKSKHGHSEIWIQTYMKDNNYDLINTDMDYSGDADCLFTAIKIALSDVRKYITVSSMRDMVIKHVSDKVYNNYKINYNNADKELKKIKAYVKELIERNKYLENKIKNTNIRNEKITLVKDAEENIITFNTTKKELKKSMEKYKDISFMKGIDTIDQFKSLIKTNLFHVDKWSIYILEREMNIKIVLFSEEAYNSGDIYNVVDCGLNGNIIANSNANSNAFSPDYYILVGYTKKHYQLITYRRRCAFTFHNLNDSIKNLIIDKIQERNAFIYSDIPEFKNYMKKLNITLKDVININLQSELYSGETVFQIYEYSNDNYEPGKGIGEILDKREVDHYKELRNCESWRRKLSDVYKFSLNKEMDQSIQSIISQNNELQTILKYTKNAKIVYFVPKSTPIPATMLMKIRKNILI